jgi:hypothetical protein
MLSYLSRNEGDHLERQDVRKRKTHKLIPIPAHHFGDVEPGQEGDGDHFLESLKKAKSQFYWCIEIGLGQAPFSIFFIRLNMQKTTDYGSQQH